MSGAGAGDVSVAGFRLTSERPISQNETAWIEFLRLASSDSDPAPTLRHVQAMRQLVGGCVECESGVGKSSCVEGR